MSFRRVLSSLTASAAVAGCAVIVIGVARTRATPKTDGERRSPVAATRTARPAHPSIAAASSAPIAAASSAPVAPAVSAPQRVVSTSRPVAGTPAATGLARPTASPADPSARPSTARVLARPVANRPVRAVRHRPAARPPAATPTRRSTGSHGSRLPVSYPTGSATRVITVTADSQGSTTATLQAWSKASRGGWRRYGSSVTAHVGADGIGRASEYTSKTPQGSFTLTRAFGHDSDPGTRLPYLHTRSSDWWISQAGRMYNTHQRCSSNCGFTRGDPNEHLYYETPYYNYAVVIDYNTRNAPGGVHAGRGSAFFLHVTDGAATAGCIAIPQSKLVSIMRWLTPSARPRILIGVT